MVQRIKHFDTERKAEQAKSKFTKYKSTRDIRWVVQGSSLVRIKRR